MIYRISGKHDWESALSTGNFASADLAVEGFIHCSARHQILRTANKYYRGETELVLLEIDELQLGSSVKFEDIGGAGDKFPHVYSAILVSAITRQFSLVESVDGFALPEELIA
jgi:uncharacterized protein (DUF952 family)